jgi:hypothetical protein
MGENKERLSFIQTLKNHETAIIETAAVLTASTRWVITFSPIDKTNLKGIIFSMGWLWDAISAVLSISFAVVEIWATAMIMRAFNLAKDPKDKFFLGAVWFVSLVVLALVQIPPLYASLMDVPVASLEGWNALYVVATSVAAFVVIAGVSYADRFKDVDEKKSESEPEGDGNPFGDLPDDEGYWTSMLNDENKPGVQIIETVPTPVETPVVLVPKENEAPVAVDYQDSPKADKRIVVDGYQGFADAMSKMNGNKPKNGNQVSEVFKASKKTGYAWWEKWNSEAQK